MEISYDHNSTKILLLNQMFLEIKNSKDTANKKKLELTKFF